MIVIIEKVSCVLTDGELPDNIALAVPLPDNITRASRAENSAALTFLFFISIHIRSITALFPDSLRYYSHCFTTSHVVIQCCSKKMGHLNKAKFCSWKKLSSFTKSYHS